MSDKMREAFEAWAKATTGWDLYPFGTDQYADHKTNAAWFAWQAALAQAEQRGEAVASEWRKRFGENPLSSTRRSECDEYTWRLMVLCQDMMEALERTAPPAQAEQRGGVSGWYCAHCQHGVDPVDVTFGEKHVYCGYPVTDCPAPPAPVVPDRVTRYEMPEGLYGINSDAAWASGWNACRDSMLAAAPEVKP